MSQKNNIYLIARTEKKNQAGVLEALPEPEPLACFMMFTLATHFATKLSNQEQKIQVFLNGHPSDEESTKKLFAEGRRMIMTDIFAKSYYGSFDKSPFYLPSCASQVMKKNKEERRKYLAKLRVTCKDRIIFGDTDSIFIS